jgi:LysR family glycine cleavage system transcriptional activator
MAEPKTPLPPFAALRAFHAAAVKGRFRDAADSLGITESAISHQVRRLEDFLRVALFDRSGSGVRLTAAGRRYLEEIDPAIRQIQAATEALLRPGGRTVVRLTMPPSLAASWVIPQLGAFERAHPDIELQLVATTRVLDLRRDQVELAIRHGKGNWPDGQCGELIDRIAAGAPVCKLLFVVFRAVSRAHAVPEGKCWGSREGPEQSAGADHDRSGNPRHRAERLHPPRRKAG